MGARLYEGEAWLVGIIGVEYSYTDSDHPEYSGCRGCTLPVPDLGVLPDLQEKKRTT